MFKILITTTEYFNGKPTRTESAQYYRQYKTSKAARNKAAQLNETVQAAGSPLKYVTTTKVLGGAV
ncbi:hypothetical protein [Serratia oryzae]|uniref:hypothetical protein n=1 Tax=Serratia oryzae TaxID=2034155 RepID=UPI0012E1A7D4|nr:hypothetical protein [Serratia oryzae]